MSRPGWIITVQYVVEAPTAEAALERAKEIVHDPLCPVSSVAVGETRIYNELTEL
jgi:uncharacterized OsmC-like protein